tara:strand:- start:607 stop:3192 length:2586 start_codon:yes stop_codon:yes gene_type:complete
MAIHYVDYEGAAGTGDGSSYANRAEMIRDISASVAAGDTIRIKKSPDPTSLGTGEVRLAPGHGYNATSEPGSQITYSGTDGETKLTGMGRGWITGDIIHVLHQDTNAGKSISGLWRVTLESGTDTNATLKLDDFPGPSDTSASSTTFYWVAAVNAIYLNSNNLTKSIACRDPYRTAWTASANTTASYSHPSFSAWSGDYNYTLFTGADQIATTASTATGMAAYYELPDTLDLSGYQQISFAFKANAVRDDDVFSLRLCTDTAGSTSVHTIPIVFAKQNTSAWAHRTVNLGTNLNSSIKSIAIYKDNTVAATTIYLQNIIACKADSSADSISLDKLIGLNTAADKAWYPISAIWDNIVFLDVSGQTRASWGYYGSSCAQFSVSNNSATIYQRKQIHANNSHLTQDYNMGWDVFDDANGTEASPVTISGGWDDSSMSTRNGKTCIALNCRMIPIYATKDHIHFEHIYASRMGRVWHQNKQDGIGFTECGFSKYWRGFKFAGGTSTVTKFGIDFMIGSGGETNDVFDFEYVQFTGSTLTDFYIKSACGLGHAGSVVKVLSPGSVKLNTLNLLACGPRPFYVNSFGTLTAETFNWGYNFDTSAVNYLSGGGSFSCGTYNAQNAYYTPINNTGGNFSVSNFNLTSVLTSSTSSGSTYYRYGNTRGVSYTVYNNDPVANTLILDANFIASSCYINKGKLKIKDALAGSSSSPSNFTNYYAGAGASIQEKNYNQGTGDRVIFDGFEVFPETSVRHTASGFAWKGYGTKFGSFPLGQVVVNANSAVTIGLWTYKTSSSGKVTLKIPGAVDKGFADQTVDSSSASINTWVKIEKTFTPTASGAITIEVTMDSGGSGSQYVYIDDLEVSQA